MLSVTFKPFYAKRPYAECRYTESRGANILAYMVTLLAAKKNSFITL
jgi:hypothetical protein